MNNVKSGVGAETGQRESPALGKGARSRDDIPGLFQATFAASEGAAEGELVGRLARDLVRTTSPEDIRIFTARVGDTLAGCIIFSRLFFDRSDRQVFLLAPVAVATQFQGRGVGTALIEYGLHELRSEGVDLAVTYGDPAYYGRIGFLPVSTDRLSAPLPLTQPEGWLAQSLRGTTLETPDGPSRCVDALNEPAYW